MCFSCQKQANEQTFVPPTRTVSRKQTSVKKPKARAWSPQLGDCPIDDDEHTLCQLWGKCEAKQGEACTQIGHLYASGVLSGTPDKKGAQRFYRLGCRLGRVVACSLTGKHSTVQMGTVATKQQLAFTVGLCQKKSGEGCMLLADYYLSLPRPDHKKSFAFARRACSLGVAKACLSLGKLYEKGDEPVMLAPKKAMFYFTLSCQLGAMEGCAYQAEGLIQEKKRQEAIPLLRKSCNDKEQVMRSCAQLALLMLKGKVKGRIKWAKTLLKRSCDEGFGATCFALAGLHQSGRWRVPKSKQKAHLYFKKACEGGHALGCRRSIKWFSRRASTRRAKSELQKLRRMACFLKDHKACYTLGHAFRRDKKLLNAVGFFKQACLKKYKDACYWKVRLSEMLNERKKQE